MRVMDGWEKDAAWACPITRPAGRLWYLVYIDRLSAAEKNKKSQT